MEYRVTQQLDVQVGMKACVAMLAIYHTSLQQRHSHFTKHKPYALYKHQII